MKKIEIIGDDVVIKMPLTEMSKLNDALWSVAQHFSELDPGILRMNLDEVLDLRDDFNELLNKVYNERESL